ncbi:MAG TPA: hypothetical protein PKK15_10395, partial [Kouleothrix sp.]|nr:hypothetical protein [Kouleothrix sp.]
MLYTGIDLIEIARIERAVARWGDRFLRHVYTPAELAAYRARLPSLAARYQHPLDQRSLAALESVPGVSALVRKLVEATVERYDRLFHQSSFVRVGGGQLPGLLKL